MVRSLERDGWLGGKFDLVWIFLCMYRRFSVIPQGLLLSLPFSLLGDFQILFFWISYKSFGGAQFVEFVTCFSELVVWSFELVDFCCKEFGGRSANKARIVRSEPSDGPFFPMHYWRFGLHFWTVCLCLRTILLGPADSPPPLDERSALSPANCQSPLLFEFCFHFALSLDLFLGLVGPLWLRDLRKLMWESLVVILGLSRFSRRNFYPLPFTPPPPPPTPLFGRLIGPSLPNTQKSHKRERQASWHHLSELHIRSASAASSQGRGGLGNLPSKRRNNSMPFLEIPPQLSRN
jgi:hypothetical protein